MMGWKKKNELDALHQIKKLLKEFGVVGNSFVYLFPAEVCLQNTG